MAGLNKTKQALLRELEDLRKEHNALKASCEKDFTERMRAEEKLKENEFNLKERIKELNGIYSLGLSIEKLNDYEAVYNELVKIIVPESMQFPQKVYASLEIDNKKYCNLENINLLPNRKYLSAPINLFGTKAGELLVGYTEDLPFIEFFEQKLITAFAERISKFTERKREENLLVASETSYRRLFESAKDGILILDAESGMIKDVNPFLITLLGFSKEQFLEKTIWEIGFFKDIVANQDRFTELQQKEYVRYEDLPLETADGRKINVEFVSNVYFVDHHHIVQCNIRDVTERKRADEALRLSEVKYRSLFENVQDVFYQIDLSGIINEVSPSIKHFSEFKREEILGTNVSGLYYNPADREILLNAIKKNGEVRDFELIFKTKSGEKRFASINARLISDANGKPNHIDGSLRDITERKQTEEELLKEQYLMSALMENLPDHIYFKDLESRFIRNNRAHVLSFGLSAPDQMAGKSDFDFFEKEIARQQYEDEQEIIRTGQSVNKEEFTVRNDKSVNWYYTTKMPLRKKDGTIIGTFGISRDITDRKRGEEELILAKEKAEESDRLKSAFLANISHEIRTPMNGILGFAELLKEPQLTGEEQQEYIGIIQKSGARMLNIINDIVSISKIESGQMKISISATNINEQIEYIYNFFTPEADKKGIQFSIKNILPSEETLIKTDREKLYAILTNLVYNALKFTQTGSIEFGVEKKGSYLEFFVKDTGVGIHRDQMEIIFERFRQGNDSSTRYVEGAGLGLSISKAYVEMLGGKIWLESEEGKGSIFYFTIPYSTETEAKTVSKEVPSGIRADHQGKDMKILIVEDDESSEKLIIMTVRNICKEILKAGTGVEAVEACRNNPDLDLVLMDIKMPIMNGYEATRQIRQFNKDVIIIAQTAYGLSGDREKAIGAGCNDYISKPIKIDELKGLIQKHFRK
jgi:PAS domain S-box-containing protein